MYPILFQMGSLRVYSYGVFIVIGIFLATWWFVRKIRKTGRSTQFIVDFVLYVLVAGIIGARLAYVLLYNPFFYFTHPWHILMLQEGGLAFYGAFIFGLVATFLFTRKNNLPFFNFLDVGAPSLALGYAVARIGCFLNGCCYGKPTDLSWGVIFPVVDGLARHPTQLYSSLAGMVIFSFLEFLLPRSKFEGQIFSTFLILYGLTRSGVELFRENTQLWGSAGIPAYAALVLALGGGLFYYYQARKRDQFPQSVLNQNK